jgi:hypothetical protein
LARLFIEGRMVRGALLMFRSLRICFFLELNLNLVHGDV